MSSVLAVGSVAFDSIKTPFGARSKCLGGSATHFSVAASYLTDVAVVAVVGDDFTAEDEAVFHERDINTSDIQRVKGGKTFFSRRVWNRFKRGSYLGHAVECVRRLQTRPLLRLVRHLSCSSEIFCRHCSAKFARNVTLSSSQWTR